MASIFSPLEMNFSGLFTPRTNERYAAARIAVEFGKHYAVEIQPLVELAGRIHGILTRHPNRPKSVSRPVSRPV